MLGMRNHRQKREQRERVRPPQGPRRPTCAVHKERRQIRGHQQKNQQRDQARTPRKLAQPPGPNQESPHKQPRNACRAGGGEGGREVEIQPSHAARRIEKRESEDRSAVVQRHQREGAERPRRPGREPCL